jgi:hypothetical protein
MGTTFSGSGQKADVSPPSAPPGNPSAPKIKLSGSNELVGQLQVGTRVPPNLAGLTEAISAHQGEMVTAGRLLEIIESAFAGLYMWPWKTAAIDQLMRECVRVLIPDGEVKDEALGLVRQPSWQIISWPEAQRLFWAAMRISEHIWDSFHPPADLNFLRIQEHQSGNGQLLNGLLLYVQSGGPSHLLTPWGCEHFISSTIGMAPGVWDNFTDHVEVSLIEKTDAVFTSFTARYAVTAVDGIQLPVTDQGPPGAFLPSEAATWMWEVLQANN